MSNRRGTSVASELELIHRRNGGITPDAVVEFAKNPTTELHSKFTWDDHVAGHQYRLWQARQLIVTVVWEPADESSTMNVTVQKYHSIVDEEGNRAYYDIVNIMSSKEKKESLLAEALRDLESFRDRYSQLQELSEVFSAIQQVKRPKVKKAKIAKKTRTLRARSYATA